MSPRRRLCPPGCAHAATPSAYRLGCRQAGAREAHRLYNKRHREGRLTPAYIDGTGTRRRIQALAALGWPAHALGPHLGICHQQVIKLGKDARVRPATAYRVGRLYERLSGTPGPSDQLSARARAAGWAPPLAWHDIDIDDPATQPRWDADPDDTFDEVTVDRVAGGHILITTLRPHERRTVIARLTDRGLTATEIAEATRLAPRSVERLRAANRTAA